MRLHSTPESAIKGEITLLAIIECVASIAIYLAVCAYLGTFKYLATAIVVAPLMLLRTEASSEWGLRVYERYYDSVESEQSIASLFFWGVLLGPIVGIGLRIVSMLYWVVRTPLKTLSEMPQNWLRQALCTDFYHPPEVLPLEAAKGADTLPRFVDMIELIAGKKGILVRGAGLIMFSPIFLLGFIPSLFYRISFKATCVAYTPFIWIAHITLQNRMPLMTRLERITKGELEKLRRVVSWAIIATLAAKVGLFYGLVDWNRIEEKFPSKKLVLSLVVPDEWPWWQLTLTADALLTFFLLFFADAALARLSNQSWREHWVLGTVSTVSFLRAAISALTISHFFKLAFVAAASGVFHRVAG